MIFDEVDGSSLFWLSGFLYQRWGEDGLIAEASYEGPVGLVLVTGCDGKVGKGQEAHAGGISGQGGKCNHAPSPNITIHGWALFTLVRASG